MQRIFDLWHGTILSQDCALQLLLIIDAICEWARDIYRLDVLRCLSRGKLDLRAITPALSISQSQNDAAAGYEGPSSMPAMSAPTPLIEKPAEPTLRDAQPEDELLPYSDAAMLDVDSFNDDDATTLPNHMDKNHKLLKYDRRHRDAAIWTKLATIHHSNLVRFTFRYFEIPEDLSPLRELVETLNGFEDLATSARETLSLFESQSSLQTDMAAIAIAAETWTGDSNFLMAGIETPSDRPLQARIAFHTFFDTESWQTVRILECFTCSQKAWNLLLQVSGYKNPPTQHPWMSDQRVGFSAYVTPLRYLHSKRSVTAALLNLEMQLCGPESPDASSADLAWEASAKFRREDLFDRNDHLEAGPGRHHGYARSLTIQWELLSTVPGVFWLDSMLEASSLKAEHDAILLRKPPTWPASCPFFCLTVFNRDVNFEDERSLGQLLETVLDSEDIYIVKDGDNKITSFSDLDRQSTKLWLQILKGSEQADTMWPLLS